MKPEAQRIAVAEVVGWKLSLDCDRFGNRYYERDGQFRKAGLYCTLPNFLKDLNAMRDAEQFLESKFNPAASSPQHWELYRWNLIEITSGHKQWYNGTYIGSGGLRDALTAIHATAAQRAEAFLRTLNLWRDE